MKRFLAALACLCLCLSLCACGESGETVLDDKAFLSNMKKGLEARWDIPERNSTASELRACHTECVNAELNAIGDLDAYTFENEELRDLAYQYVAALNSQLEGIKYYGIDNGKHDRLYYDEGYNRRAEIIYLLVTNHGLTVSSKYTNTLQEVVNRGMILHEQKIEIVLRTELPQNFKDGDKTSVTVTDFSYEVGDWYDGKVSVTIFLSGKKTYDSKGEGYSRAVRVGWKLYDEDGTVLDSGTVSSSDVKMDENFSGASATISGLHSGVYTLEIMSLG